MSGSLTAAQGVKAERWGDTEFSVQWRCSQMAKHDCPTGRGLPVPCPKCYSVAVTGVVIPYRTAQPWAKVTR